MPDSVLAHITNAFVCAVNSGDGGKVTLEVETEGGKRAVLTLTKVAADRLELLLGSRHSRQS